MIEVIIEELKLGCDGKREREMMTDRREADELGSVSR